jgi:hypothetical protein
MLWHGTLFFKHVTSPDFSCVKFSFPVVFFSITDMVLFKICLAENLLLNRTQFKHIHVLEYLQILILNGSSLVPPMKVSLCNVNVIFKFL